MLQSNLVTGLLDGDILDLQQITWKHNLASLFSTSGFWLRVRARALRAPVLLCLLICQRGRCAPLAHGSFAASYSSPKNNYFQKQIASLLAQTRGYLSAGLSCPLLSYLQGARDIGARFPKLFPASAVSPIMTKFSHNNPHSTCYVVRYWCLFVVKIKGP
jgi:hypothetical protein